MPSSAANGDRVRRRRRLRAQSSRRREACRSCGGAGALPCRRDARRAAPRPSRQRERAACRARTAQRIVPPPCAGIGSRAGDRRRVPSARREKTIRYSCRPTPCGGDCCNRDGSRSIASTSSAARQACGAHRAIARRDCPSAIRAPHRRTSRQKNRRGFAGASSGVKKQGGREKELPGHHTRSRKTRLPGRMN